MGSQGVAALSPAPPASAILSQEEKRETYLSSITIVAGSKYPKVVVAHQMPIRRLDAGPQACG